MDISALDGHLHCFQFEAILNNAAINFHVQIIVWTHAFISLWYIPNTGSA